MLKIHMLYTLQFIVLFSYVNYIILQVSQIIYHYLERISYSEKSLFRET